jgi:predicted DNA-binding protein (MmcQ/YjbR family)
MSLHERTAFTAFVTALRGVTRSEQWEALVGKVGGKVFCLLGDVGGEILFKVSEIGFDGLVELEGIGQAAYFAKRQWVRVAPGALDDELLAGYIRAAHAIIAGKLTRKLRTELGL